MHSGIAAAKALVNTAQQLIGFVPLYSAHAHLPLTCLHCSSGPCCPAASLEIEYPMLFKVSNRATGRFTHCGVLEFIAQEGHVYLPRWVGAAYTDWG